MNIQAFIANWDSPTCDAELLRRQLDPFYDTKILQAYDVPFAVQWHEALSRFTGDVLLWVMADVRLPQAPVSFLVEMEKVLSRSDIWMYAPNLEWTSTRYNPARCTEILPGVIDVANTDQVICAVKWDLLNIVPPLSTQLNPRGWRYDYLMTAVARRFGAHAVRDTRFTATHPYGSIYSTEAAQVQTDAWHRSLPLEWQNQICSLMDEQGRNSKE
jgi:hypothetical protein